MPFAEEYELWEIAAALGAHRIETFGVYAEREIIAKAEAYYEETKEQRQQMLAGYAERRKARAKERRTARQAKVI